MIEVTKPGEKIMVQASRKMSGVLLMCVALATLSCGKKKEDEPGASTLAQLVGSWNGSITKRIVGTNNTTKASLTANFYDSKEYEITDNDLAQTAKGQFFIFEDQQHLNFIVKESTFTQFFLESEPQDYQYQFYDNDTMLLRADSATIYLTKSGSAANQTGSNMSGKWQCVDSADNQWELEIGDKDVRIAINGSGVSSKIKGTMSSGDPEEKGNVKVRTLNVDEMYPAKSLQSINMEFNFDKQPATLNLIPLTSQGQVGETINCNRAK
jgi:hypothetical protein